jgi:thiol:disulfide interchange protein DsbD
MIKPLLTFFALVAAATLSAQTGLPVQWKFSSKKMNATTYEIHLTAKMDENWHIYSQSTPDGGPTPTSISFLKNPLLSLQGQVQEVGKMEKHFERLFGVEVRQFSGKVDFVQTVVVKGKVKTALNGTVSFMTCNDEECLPAKALKFSIPVGGK